MTAAPQLEGVALLKPFVNRFERAEVDDRPEPTNHNPPPQDVRAESPGNSPSTGHRRLFNENASSIHHQPLPECPG